MNGASFANPVHPGYFADPFVFRHEGTYFAVGTGHEEAAGMPPPAGEANTFPLLRSSDLVTWTSAGHALVRPDAALGDTPFIMITAEAKSENVIAAKKAGVNNYIVKPFNAQTLKGKIETVFQENV